MINWIRWTFFRDRYLWVWLSYGYRNHRVRIQWDGDAKAFARHMGRNNYLTNPEYTTPHGYRWSPINFKTAAFFEGAVSLREVA